MTKSTGNIITELERTDALVSKHCQLANWAFHGCNGFFCSKPSSTNRNKWDLKFWSKHPYLRLHLQSCFNLLILYLGVHMVSKRELQTDPSENPKDVDEPRYAQFCTQVALTLRSKCKKKTGWYLESLRSYDELESNLEPSGVGGQWWEALPLGSTAKTPPAGSSGNAMASAVAKEVCWWMCLHWYWYYCLCKWKAL